MKIFNLKNVLILFVFALTAILIFAFLDAYPISMWDEARLANNALEMDISGNWLITTFDNIPDYGNVKFPLLIWLEVISMRCFGFNEFGLRLPVATAVFLLCVYLYWYSVKYLKDFKIGLIAILVLVTSNGFMDIHAGRTGDYDALLSLFTTIFVLSFFNYIQFNDKKQLLISCIGFVLAVFTKSIAGALFLLPIIFYTYRKNKIIELLKTKEIYLGIILFLGTIGTYVLIRSNVQSDYIESIIRVDTIGRAVNSIDGHQHPFGYYWHLFFQFHFAYWVLFLIACLVYTFTEKQFKYREIISYIALLMFFHMMTISLCKSKLQWYSIPNIPLASLVAAMFINEIFQTLASNKSKILSICFLIAIFIQPYFQVFNKVYHGKGLIHNPSFKYAIDFVKSDRWRDKELKCVDEGYFADLKFYVGIAKKFNQNISIVSKDDIAKGDRLMIYKPEILNAIKRNWQFNIIENKEDYYYIELMDRISNHN